MGRSLSYVLISLSYILFGTLIIFQIIAKDMNGSAGYLSSDALIKLTIIDVNDETPTVNTMNTSSVSCVLCSIYFHLYSNYIALAIL